MAEAEARLRDHFLGWQCRIRLEAMRRYGGRPTPGMRPRVLRAGGGEVAPAVTVLLIEKEPTQSTALFRHIVCKTHDPGRRYDDAVKALSAAHFQRPETFSDVMTALFPVESATAKTLANEGRCVLAFDQFGQGYRIECAVNALDPGNPAYQATCWHNAMFNAAMPGAVRVLAFTPDWRRATAHPPV